MNSLVLLILGTGMGLFARGVLFNSNEKEKLYSSKQFNKRAYRKLLLVK